MAAKKKSKKSGDKKKKSVQKQVKPTKKKNASAGSAKAKTKKSKANKKPTKKKTAVSKKSPVKKKTTTTSAKTNKLSKKSSPSSKSKVAKKTVKKVSAAKKNIRKSAAAAKKTTRKTSIAAKKTLSKSQKTKSNHKPTLPKKKTSNVKFTKADAAKTKPAASYAQTSPEKSTSSTRPSVTKKETPSKKNDTSAKDTITIEKVMEETEDKNFLPKSLQPTEKTGFSDSLSEDLSSVYARTSEEMPEPAGKYVMEFICKAAPELLYKFLTDPVELAEWFCDSVNIRNGIYTFVWNGVPQQARLVKQERNVSVRYQWIDKNDGSYFEFSIYKNYLTGDVVLYVTDFSTPEELESNKLWWTNQINKLKTILGLQY